ncbi:MAG: mandelate racemase/muconate lactonizing protein [Chloroflexota bacterium]|nr:mandelate racemase/muconate lactonizing protein [Chloroflexota bacterium]
MKITNLRLRELTGSFDFDGEFWEERLSRPIDVYPEYKAQGPVPGFWLPHKVEEGRYQIRSVVLQVETDEGVYGLSGMVAHDIAYIIDQQFRGLLVGKDPRATERLWDMMYREAVHGRKGPTMIAISAIDCALWDLKGRWLGQPVYRLLGGPIRETVPAYASMLGYSLEPDKVRQRAREVAEQGYTATKWFPRHGPTDGRAGIAKNVELMATLREAVGPDVDVMLDAWMSWDVPYTVKLAERLVEYAPRWIEEPVMPDKVDACAEIRRRSPVPTATGEHEYTRWGLKGLMDARAADVLQPDTFWAGGISEMVKIAALASTYDVPVIPHGHSVPANLHLTAALPTTSAPILEYLVKWNELLQFFWTDPVKPVDGYVTVPQTPGIGIEIDPAKVESERDLSWVDRPTLAEAEE